MRAAIGLLILSVAPGFAAESGRSLPLFFFPNTARTGSAVRFIAETPELRAGFRPDSAIFETQGIGIEVRFAGANPRVAIEGADPMPGKANFFNGRDAKNWKTGVATYRKVVYRGLYPGIDMSYGGSGRRIKSEFIVAPGADPGQIRLEYPSADKVRIDEHGDLVVNVSGAELREEAPAIYQGSGSGRVRIEGRYRLLNAHTVGFELGAYDTSQVLIVDPVVSYCTFLGGSATFKMTKVAALAADASGDLYVTGWTESADFPIAGAFQGVYKGDDDAFVVKLDPAGTELLYATYIGGSGEDQATGIAIDSSGQAYVTGFTQSTDFPVASAIRSTLGGSRNAFALKLNALGSALVYSTYLGGTDYDSANAIAADGSGNAYIAGYTLSPNFTGANPTTFGGKTDAFVTKLTSFGGLSFSKFLGGADVDQANAVAVDSAGNIYVAGGTFSTNFPIVGVIQSVNGGGQDAFAAKLSSSGSTLYSTYLGGSGGTQAVPEQANAIAVDAGGNAYVAGVTNSTNFPVTSGALQTSFGGGEQGAFALKINPAGNALVYSTYLGGTESDQAWGIAIDTAGDAYIAGQTSSSGFPIVNAVQATFGGAQDAFVTELNAAGNGLVFSTFYGGSGSDAAYTIALDPGANVYVGGQTGSLDLPLVSPYLSTNSGDTGWLLRLGATAPPPQPPAANSVTPSSGSGATVTFTAQYSDPAGAATLATVALLVNTIPSTNFACYVTYTLASNQFTLANDLASSGSSTVLPGGGSAQNDQCTLSGAGSSASISGTALTLTVSLTFQSGASGNQTVYLYAADANGNTGWIARGAWTLPVSCPAGINPTAATPATAGGSGSVTLTIIGNCAWTSASSAPWLTVTSGASGTGNGTVNYSVAANTGSQRSATLTIAGIAFTVTQSGVTQSTAGLAFYPVTPCRVADTRTTQGKTGAFGPPSLGAYASRDFPILSSGCGIPASAKAYSLNLTVVPSGPLGFLSAWPTGQGYPGVSTLNSSDGSVIANAAIVAAGTNGELTVVAGNPTDLIIDINGYFAPPSSSGLAFYPIRPCRVADTRASQPFTGAFGPPSLTAYKGRDFPIASSPCGVPSSAQAYSLNMTVVPSGPLGFLSAWPTGQGYPGVSTLNSSEGTVLANAAIVPAGSGGAITVDAGNPTDLIIDVNGYFAPPGGAGALNFYSVAPCRAADTRSSQPFTGAFGPPSLKAYSSRDFPIQSAACAIPSTAQAYSLNLTAVPQGPLSFLSAWPSGQGYPGVSTLNSSNGNVIANAAIVPAGANGAVTIDAGNPTDLIVDVNGYFAP